MTLAELNDAIAAVCPIDGVNSDGVIWFKPEATDAQKQAAQSIISNPPVFNYLPQEALAQLNIVTGVSGQIMRCMAAGVAVPSDWSAYVVALRNIANGTDKTSTVLPTEPSFVAGT